MNAKKESKIMLSETKGKLINKFVKDYCIFDLETTGISVNTDDVIEISAVKVIDGKVDSEYTSLVNPMRPIPYFASSVNNIYDDMVADAPVFSEALADFMEFVGDFTLVGHNIHSFDMKFLYRDAEKYWGKTIGNDYIDTLKMAKICLPQLRSHKLTTLAEYYGIATDGAHRALNDCRMNWQVYEHLAGETVTPDKAKQSMNCPKCGSIMQKRTGRYGEFYGCSGYPACRFTMNV